MGEWGIGSEPMPRKDPERGSEVPLASGCGGSSLRPMEAPDPPAQERTPCWPGFSSSPFPLMPRAPTQAAGCWRRGALGGSLGQAHEGRELPVWPSSAQGASSPLQMAQDNWTSLGVRATPVPWLPLRCARPGWPPLPLLSLLPRHLTWLLGFLPSAWLSEVPHQCLVSNLAVGRHGLRTFPLCQLASALHNL